MTDDVPRRPLTERGPIGELTRFVRAALIVPVPRDHRISDEAFRRRRVVVGVTLVVGAVLLGWSLAITPGDPIFYLATVLLAVVWVAGAMLSGPLYRGRANARDGRQDALPIWQPLVLGVAALLVFTLGALIVIPIPFLRDSVNEVLDHARFGSLPIVALVTVMNGVAEETFFRGALYSAIGVRRPVIISTVVYGLTTIVTLNVMLVFSAVVLGVLLGLQRRVTGGVLAPIITHCVWSLGMLFVLPPLFQLFT